MNLSIIIPLYNAEKYLERCLKSIFVAAVFAPKIKVEIILIDNDSNDQSVKIAREFAQKSPLEIRLLECHTPGASAVRNMGVKKAKGEYIWFIDADDEITQDAILLLTNVAKSTGADLVMMGAWRIYPNGHKNYLSAVLPQERNYKHRFVRYGAGPWQFLIRRSWWIRNQFEFREGIIHEDMELISSLILYTDKFSAANKALYHYYQNDNSVLHKKNWDPHYLDIFLALEGLYEKFQKKGTSQEYYDDLEWFFIWNLLIDSHGDFARFKEGRAGFKKSREILKKYFPNWRKNRYLRQKHWKFRTRVYLNFLFELFKGHFTN